MSGKKLKLLIFGNLNDLHCRRWGMWFIDHGHDVSFSHAPKFGLSYIRSLKKDIEKFEPDILNSHYAGSWSLMAYLTGFKPHVATIHGSEVLEISSKKKKIVAKVLQSCDLVTTDSKRIYDIVSAWGVNVKMVQWGLDSRLYKPCAEKTFYPSVISIRSLEPFYDIETIMKAVKITQERWNPETVLEVYGTGSLKDSLVGKRQKNVRFMGMAKPSSIPAILSRSWVYVSAAKGDSSICFSTAEAMACKLPVVVSNVGENTDWVPETWTFPPGDHFALADRLITILSMSAPQRLLIGQRNRSKIIQDFDVSIHMGYMEKLYQEVLQK